MKQYLFTLLLWSTTTFAFAGSGSSSAHDNSNQGGLLRSNFTIDMFDTVVFDISQSTMAGNQVSFPVYFLSDDTINALDFSLKFDETNFSFDQITNLTNYLVPTDNMNSGILYFTSYSLQNITNDTPLVSIRLNMLGHYLCSDDLDSILVYLNGDPCSVKVIECLSDKVTETNIGSDLVSIYPNPASGMLNIKSPENATIELLDVNGSQVLSQMADAKGLLQINTSGIAGGVYMVKIFNDNFVSVKKIIIN